MKSASKKAYAKAVATDPGLVEKLLKPITGFKEILSSRTYNCLLNEGIVYVGDILTRSERELLGTPNFGRRSLEEVKNKILEPSELSFGMSIPFWPLDNWVEGEPKWFKKDEKEEAISALSTALAKAKAQKEPHKQPNSAIEALEATSSSAKSAIPRKSRVRDLMDKRQEARALRGIGTPR